MNCRKSVCDDTATSFARIQQRLDDGYYIDVDSAMCRAHYLRFKEVMRRSKWGIIYHETLTGIRKERLDYV